MLEQKREQEEYSRNRDAPADDETLLAVTGIANGFPTRMREVQRREPLASEEEGKKEGKNEGKKEEEEEEEDSKEAEADEGSVVRVAAGFRIVVLANPPGWPFQGNDFFRECGDVFATQVVGALDLPSELQARVKVRWDERFVYFGAELREPFITANVTGSNLANGPPYHDNDFEIFIDVSGTTQYCV